MDYWVFAFGAGAVGAVGTVATLVITTPSTVAAISCAFGLLTSVENKDERTQPRLQDILPAPNQLNLR